MDRLYTIKHEKIDEKLSMNNIDNNSWLSLYFLISGGADIL